MLASAGHEVRQTADGAEALEALDEDGADVVFSDLVMPRMSGVEHAAEIRRRHPDTTVVLTSGQEKPAGAEADAFVQKPYALGELLQVLDAVARR